MCDIPRKVARKTVDLPRDYVAWLAVATGQESYALLEIHSEDGQARTTSRSDSVQPSNWSHQVGQMMGSFLASRFSGNRVRCCKTAARANLLAAALNRLTIRGHCRRREESRVNREQSRCCNRGRTPKMPISTSVEVKAGARLVDSTGAIAFADPPQPGARTFMAPATHSSGDFLPGTTLGVFSDERLPMENLLRKKEE